MMEGLKPYPKMKDSGVPWCPRIPAHWDLIPNRAFLTQRKVLVGEKHTDYSLLSLTKQGVIVRDISDNKGKFSADMGTSQEVRKGNLVMCLFDVPETPRTIGLSRHDGMITGAYTVFEVREDDVAMWLEAFYVAMDDRKLLSPLYSGLRHTIPKTRFLSTHTPLPSADERGGIVRFLTHADRRIRRLIRSKQILITLLEEQKQAIIHRAVTRGLDPKVRLKPSGISWVGEVPEHWDVMRCRHLFREVDARSPDGSELHLSMSQRLGLVPSDLVDNRTLVSESYAGGKLCQIGDLVLNRLKAHLGVFSVARHAGVISPDYTVLRPLDPVGVEYFEKVLRSPACRRELQIRAKGIVEGFWRLYTDDFYDIRLPAPPAAERLAIIDQFTASTNSITKSVIAAQREIDLLKELRTRLISDVVTGKLDVREVAARLPADDLATDDAFDESEAVADSEEDDDLVAESSAEDGDGG